MFEAFTDRSRRLIAMANLEAIRRGYSTIDTEHILLALAVEE
jgi:Clp amino terminal domain, pathogenicity island component